MSYPYFSGFPLGSTFRSAAPQASLSFHQFFLFSMRTEGTWLKRSSFSPTLSSSISTMSIVDLNLGVVLQRSRVISNFPMGLFAKYEIHFFLGISKSTPASTSCWHRMSQLQGLKHQFVDCRWCNTYWPLLPQHSKCQGKRPKACTGHDQGLVWQRAGFHGRSSRTFAEGVAESAIRTHPNINCA